MNDIDMPNLSIKNVPAEIVTRLHERAAANHRSLQGELMALVTRAAGESSDAAATVGISAVRRGHRTIEEIAAEHRQRVKRPIRKGGRSTDLVRAERDAR